VAAQLALVAATVRERAPGELSGAELASAGERLMDLEHLDFTRRGMLAAEILEGALTWLGLRAARRTGEPPAATILNVPFTVTGIRQELERVYRALARTAPTRRERTARVDRANAVRPRTWV
jgi:serine/threonine-protein kinase PknG